MSLFIQSLVDGLLIGGVYAAIAVGLSLAFGVMRIVNWAHGELLMVSMYIAYFLFAGGGVDPYLTMFFGGIVMYLLGFLLQKTILSKLLDRDSAREPISVLLFTVGLSMFLTNLALVLIGPNPLSAVTRNTGKMIEIGNIMVSVPKIISFVIALICTLALYGVLMKTEVGRAIRATSQNRQVAALMGVNQKKIYCIAFGTSLALVGISGALLIPYYPVSTTIGATFGFRTFVVVVLGGQGSVIGALLGGIIIGIIEKIGGLMFSDTVAQMLVFIIFVAVLIFRPYGLLGEKEA